VLQARVALLSSIGDNTGLFEENDPVIHFIIGDEGHCRERLAGSTRTG
jgi:hypothetical protein